ncbi:MAG TPA: RNA polymerase sigma factor SigJ [Candidatus Cybelea sp.]|nr:RNA polymerase sigma factor SigJ [Candidatus Cybelea sp.]
MTATDAAAFERHRRRLFALAYRMLGEVGAAEDAVQDTYLRWHKSDRTQLRSEEAWLVTACTRICIDRLRQAQAERKAYIGQWLPEPLVVAPTPEEPLAESLSTAFLLLLERLSPPERAAYLLHEVFDYDYGDVAGVLERGEPACRQLVSRARRHLKDTRPRFSADADVARVLAARFAEASRRGDPAAFADILARDVRFWSDGGGKAAAALNIIEGRDKCVRFILGIARKQPPGLAGDFAWINGQPGLILRHASGAVYATVCFDIADGVIRAIYAMRNPDKLARVAVG